MTDDKVNSFEFFKIMSRRNRILSKTFNLKVGIVLTIMGICVYTCILLEDTINNDHIIDTILILALGLSFIASYFISRKFEAKE